MVKFERALICARTGEGRKRAQMRGQHTGRPRLFKGHQRTEAMAALRSGTATQADLARHFKVSQSTISRLAASSDSTHLTADIDADTKTAIHAFMNRIAGRYSIQEAILFGSRAHRTHNPQSDADIAVILDGPIGKRSEAALDMARVAFDVLLETGILVEALPLWQHEFASGHLFSNPTLIENIRREGLRV